MLVASHLNLSCDLVLASLLGVLRQFVGIVATGMLSLRLATSVTSMARLARILGGVAIACALKRSLRQLGLLL